MLGVLRGRNGVFKRWRRGWSKVGIEKERVYCVWDVVRWRKRGCVVYVGCRGMSVEDVWKME